MSLLPPDTIQVKRKRGVEDEPVDFLQVEANKRHRNLSGEGTWVYQRKQVEPARNTAAEPTVPTIKATQEGDEKRPVKPLRRQVIPSTRAGDGTPASLPVPTAADLANENIRRFHLSRSNSPLPTAGVSKKRSAAVFVERGGAKKHTLDGTPKQARLTERLVENLAATKPSPTEGDLGDATAHQQEPNGTKYKRPVATARNPPSASTPKKPTLPPSLANRNYQTSNMDQLAREMDAYTLETITRNLDRMEEDDAKARVAVLSPERKSRFRPKAPALRYAQRHPESVAPAPLVQAAELHKEEPEAMDIDMGDATDDEDYVMETYERVPASRLRDQAVPAHRVGLLVFDSEPDKIDFFFGEEGDSSDEFPEDEDDENAENYYAADYPDDEVDWDDELDRCAYRFVNHNASDNEEFDQNDFVDSDDNDDRWDRNGPSRKTDNGALF